MSWRAKVLMRRGLRGNLIVSFTFTHGARDWRASRLTPLLAIALAIWYSEDSTRPEQSVLVATREGTSGRRADPLPGESVNVE